MFMNIRVLSIRKNTDAHVSALEAEYLKRLRPFFTLRVENIRQTYKSAASPEEILRAEAVMIEKRLADNEFLIALHESGKEYTSPGLSAWLEKQKYTGARQITFLIGGPYGIHKSILGRANQTFSLSKLTLTHEHARLILLEQLYRAADIARGGKYHK